MEGAERLRWIDFNSNRQYTLSVDGRVSETGDWQLTDGLVLTPKPQGGEESSRIVYQVLEFSPGRIILRQLIPQGRSPPFARTQN